MADVTDDRTDPETVAAGSTIRVWWGHAAIRTEPDEAFLRITLTAIEPTAGPALADVAQRRASIESCSVPNGHGIPRDRPVGCGSASHVGSASGTVAGDLQEREQRRS
jgi:hypothetical protein